MKAEPIEVTDRDWWMAGAAFIMLVLSVVLLSINMVVLSKQTDRIAAEAKFAQTNREGLCQLDASLRDQRDAAVKYLIAHPNGAPALGLNRASIQQSIQKQTDLIESLRVLQCST